MIQKEKVAPEILVIDFLAELRKQAGGQITDDKLNHIILNQLEKAKSEILSHLIEEGAEIDLGNRNLNPDANNIENCLIF